MGDGVAVALITAIAGIVGGYMAFQSKQGASIVEQSNILYSNLSLEVKRLTENQKKDRAELKKIKKKFENCKKLLAEQGIEL